MGVLARHLLRVGVIEAGSGFDGGVGGFDAGAELDILVVVLLDRIGDFFFVGGRFFGAGEQLQGGLQGALDDLAAGVHFDQLDAGAGAEPDMAFGRAQEGIQLEEILAEQVHHADGREHHAFELLAVGGVQVLQAEIGFGAVCSREHLLDGSSLRNGILGGVENLAQGAAVLVLHQRQQHARHGGFVLELVLEGAQRQAAGVQRLAAAALAALAAAAPLRSGASEVPPRFSGHVAGFNQPGQQAGVLFDHVLLQDRLDACRG